MRVLMISKACVTQSYRSKLEYLNQLDSQFEVALVVPPSWGTLTFEPRPTDGSYPLLVTPVRLNGHNHFHFYPELQSIMRRYRPDLVHIDEEHYSLVTYQAIRIAEKLHIPSLFFTWQNIFKHYPWPFSTTERHVLTHAQAAIAGNQDAQEVLRKKGFHNPIWVIPQFGTDTNLYYPRDKAVTKKSQNLAGQFVIGYVGRLVTEKGLDDLWQAAQPLLAQHSDIVLLLAGQGPWADIIRSRAESLHLGNQVRILPWVTTKVMPEVMNALDVLVLPSHTTARWKEQFGRVLTEAMASEVAVAGSNSGEIPHVIKEGGIVFPEKSPTSLFKALTALYGDPRLRDNLGKAGRQRVLNHYSQEIIARNTLDVYRHLRDNHVQASRRSTF